MRLNFEQLLKKELTRAEFLGLTGATLLSVLGITSFLKNLNRSLGSGATNKLDNQTLGYGQSSYGGRNNPN